MPDEPAPKFDYRMVMRNNLTDIEVAIRDLQAQGWVMNDPNNVTPTLCQALDNIGRGDPLGIPMKRQQTPDLEPPNWEMEGLDP